MKGRYDFSKGKKNPYTKLLKKQITMNISIQVLDYMKAMSEETGIPYQTLINFFLLRIVNGKRRLEEDW